VFFSSGCKPRLGKRRSADSTLRGEIHKPAGDDRSLPRWSSQVRKPLKANTIEERVQSTSAREITSARPLSQVLDFKDTERCQVVEGARLENETGDAHAVALKHLGAHSIQRLRASQCSSM
jgi:hypothetical protein